MTEEQLDKVYEIVSSKMGKTFDGQHDLGHVDRVREKALRIAEILGLEKKIDKNLLQAICLLHDFTFAEHKFCFRTWFFEGFYAQKGVLRAIKKLGLEKKEKRLIKEAVGFHAHNFPFKGLRNEKRLSIYTKILQDADLIDYFCEKRIKTLMANEKRFIMRRVLFLLCRPLFNYSKENISRFLNFPQAADLVYL